MSYSLRSKLSISYLFLALLLTGLLIVMVNFFFEKQFQDYRIKQIQQNNQEIVSALAQQFSAETGTWAEPYVESIGIHALEQGLILKISDAGGRVVWDATVHNNGLCIQMINHMSSNMMTRYPDFEGGYMESSYAVRKGDLFAGTARIGYYGPFFLSDNDLAFISTLNRMIVIIGLVALIAALILGAVMSRRMIKPLSRAVSAAGEISRGYYGGRITEKSDTREIIQLTSAINGLAESLQTQEGLRKRLTSDVAHELRTPLATLQSHMEAMIDGIWEPDSERLKSCHEEIIRISRLVGDLEKLARFEGENLRLDKSVFDVRELAGSIKINMEAEFLQKGVHLSVQGDSTSVLADRDKISQVMINLLSNALKFTDEGGKVDLAVEQGQGQVLITVSDTGAGISEEDLPHIFERFYRADPSRNRLTGGSGIGLAIVKAIVEAHGGAVSAESEIGKGSRFTIKVPERPEEDTRR